MNERILINRTRTDKENWNRLGKVAELQNMTREELLDKLIAVYLQNINVKVEIKK